MVVAADADADADAVESCPLALWGLDEKKQTFFQFTI
jgi:hypothetical protein